MLFPQKGSNAAWLRLVLLCAGDVERNPGPRIGKIDKIEVYTIVDVFMFVS